MPGGYEEPNFHFIPLTSPRRERDCSLGVQDVFLWGLSGIEHYHLKFSVF